MPNSSTPRWMTWLLCCAAVYNLAWGAMTFAFPSQMFTWGGLAAPNYPAFVQCLGVLIGVLGVGYGIASSDPVTHWPLVLIGLLSKVFAPLGFVWAVATGELPPTFLLSILLNDVIWWLPLAAILWHAARVRSDSAGGNISTLAAELQRVHLDRGESLWDASFRQPLLIAFVRHLGCTFCREALADLKAQGERIAAAGVEPVIVHLTQPEDVQPLLDRYGVKDVAVVSDPDRRLFRAFELPLGTWKQLFGWRVLWRALAKGVVFRYGFGRIQGNPLQLTGAFLVHRGEVIRSYRNQTTADRPNYADLACGVNS